MAITKKEYDAKKLLRGMAGFILYGINKNLSEKEVLVTIAHDIREYLNNSKQKWFCPRTSRYENYLK